MPERYKVIGTSRKGGSEDEFRAVARKAVGEARPARRGRASRSGWSFSAFNADEPGPLVKALEQADERARRRAAPAALPVDPARTRSAPTVDALGELGPATSARAWCSRSRSASTSTSARELNTLVHGVFPEERVFRIDHFLGREAVQNLIALRFANGMFEPIWNRDHIDHVQIDVPETLAVDDRAGFYEDTGAYRDMVVTHLFHVLGFVAMEPPTTLEARSIVEETGKVFRSVSPDRPGERDPRPVRGLPRGPGRRPRLPDRDVHRAARRDRQLALVRRAVLPAHRQADGRAAAAADDRVPRAAAADVPARRRRSSRTTDPTTSRSTSATRAGSRPRSWPRSPGRRCASARRGWSSPTRAPSAPRGSSPTSG